MLKKIDPTTHRKLGKARPRTTRRRRPCACGTSSPPTRGGSSGSPSGSTTSCSTTRRTGSRTRRSDCSWRWRARSTSAMRSRGCSRATGSTRPRTGRSSTWRCGTGPTHPVLVDGKDVMPEVNAVLAEDAGLLGARDPSRRVEGLHRQDASRTSSTSASAAPTWARHGDRGAHAVRAGRALASISSRTWTARTSPRR